MYRKLRILLAFGCLTFCSFFNQIVQYLLSSKLSGLNPTVASFCFVLIMIVGVYGFIKIISTLIY